MPTPGIQLHFITGPCGRNVFTTPLNMQLQLEGAGASRSSEVTLTQHRSLSLLSHNYRLYEVFTDCS